MERGKTRSTCDLVDAPRIDETGACFIDEEKHYFRQESNRVLHVKTGLVNTLKENAINDSRLNWGYTFTKIDSQDFENKLKDVLETFFCII